MNKVFLIVIFVFFYSCSTTKNREVGSSSNTLPETEKMIINDFLEAELKKESYKKYTDFQIELIEEAIKKLKPISDYEFNYKYKNSWGANIKDWIIDSIKIKKLKSDLKNEKAYRWKESDLYNVKAKVLKTEELIKIINTGSYGVNETKNLIISLSRPLIIDANNALLSFDIGNGQLGNAAISHFSVLMRKINNQWIAVNYYEDGVFY